MNLVLTRTDIWSYNSSTKVAESAAMKCIVIDGV